MTSRPVILSQDMVDRALVDNAFYAQMPEFAQLRGGTTMPVMVSTGRGCSGCKRTKQKVNLFRNFVVIATSLTTEGIARLKRYFGIDGIMINVMDQKTQQIVLKIL